EAVRFEESILHAVHLGPRTFLEVGPAPTLSSMARGCAVPADARFIPSARRSDDEARELHRAVAALHVAGVAIDWRAYEAPLVRRRVTLPQYPFVRDRYWHPRVHRADASIGVVPVSGPAAGDSLLGHRVRSPLLVGHAFERELSPGAPSWLADHVVYDTVIVPAAAHLELLRLAARAAGGGAELDVVDVQIDEPLVLDGDTPSVVQTVLDDALREVTVYSAVADGWRRHARARLEVPPAHGAADRSFDDFDAVRARCTEAFDAADYYQALAQLGVDYGPAFRCILGGVRRDGEVLGTLLAPNHAEAAPAIHPALADGCLQLLGLAMAGAGDLSAASGDVYLPVGVERWRLVRDAVGTLTAHGRVRLSDAAASSGPSGEVEIGDLDLVDADGRLVAMFAGVRFKRASRAALAGPGRAAGDWFYAPHWEPVPIADTGHRATGRWVVVAGGGPVGGGLVGGGLVGAALRADGADVDEVAWVAGRLGAEVLRGPAPTGVVVDLAGRTTALDGTELADVADLVVRLADLPEAGSLTLLTGSAMAVVPGDRVTGHELATLWGIGRVAGAEHPNLRVRLVDVDRVARASAVVESVRAEVRADDREEPQVAWRDGVRYALRLSRPADLGALDVPEAGYELRITERGRLDGVALVHQEALAPGPGEVLIDVRASGLNFRDVLNVLGQYEGDASSLGSECAGVVLAVGEGVHRVQPGDRVMAIALASFATTCIAVQEVVAPVPDGMSAAEAATVPIAFLTAHYALDRLGGMGRGDRVLIHAAAGGVGMAAVQLAQRAGAEVFATAGSEVKRDVLRALGVRHVYDSRTFDFADQILRDTDGAGVDLVLNSLSGDSIAHSIEVLAPAGTFVEIGMAGIWSAERFHQERPAARYEVVFLGAVCAADPGLAAAMLDDLVGDLALGVLQPLPLVAFDIGHAVQAFRYMAQARQIGKVVVTSRPPWSRPAGGTWVVSGGLGGLGLEVAAELAQAGASRLVLFARSSPGDVAHAALERLRALGVDVRVHAVDVADRTAVDAVFADAVADGTPLRGVVHAAGVVDDGLLRSMTGARFESVLGPKVTGAANLAAAADRHHAEHVVLFAAGAGLFGATAQANYAAANAALDALAHARRAAGRPAQVLDWGPWSGVGMAAALDGAIRRWESQGIAAFDPLEGRAAFRIAVSSGRTQLAVLKLRWPALLHHYSKHGVPPIMSELVRTAQRQTVVADATPPGDLVGELVAVEPERRGDLLVQRLREQVLLVLGLEAGYPVGSRQGLTDLGMDSLMAVELSNRLSVLVDRSLPSTLAFEQPTLDDLAAHIRALLADRVDFPGSGAGTATSATSSGPSAPTGDDAALDDLTESELTDALLRELDATGY
ncbi:MAG: polyketide synthase, partial [Ilumatobacteraceae bacterium]|nr:polyketide synthase [Ilumatobacteraceae bacterium]